MNWYIAIGFILMTVSTVLLVRQNLKLRRRRGARRPARRGARPFPAGTVFQPTQPKRALPPPPLKLTDPEWLVLGEAANAHRLNLDDPAVLDSAMLKVRQLKQTRRAN